MLTYAPFRMWILCAVQELLDGYRETEVAYLDLSYFPTDALTEPGPAACVAGELKLVPGQFGMPSLVRRCPYPPSFHAPLCKQSMRNTGFAHRFCMMSGLLHQAKPVGDERKFTHLHWAALSSLSETRTQSPKQLRCTLTAGGVHTFKPESSAAFALQ